MTNQDMLLLKSLEMWINESNGDMYPSEDGYPDLSTPPQNILDMDFDDEDSWIRENASDEDFEQITNCLNSLNDRTVEYFDSESDEW